MRIERYSVASIPKQVRKRGFAILKPRPTQVLAVEFDQVKGAQDGCMVMMAVTYQIKDRQTLRIDNNRLSIDHT